MKLQAFAHHILHAETLQDKLQRPATLDFDEPFDVGLIFNGVFPAREARLKPANTRGTTVKKSLLTGSNLEDVNERISLLHTFANHELLAMELFAWALLRFPDAPASFRKGAAGIMLDEQRHCQMYCKRIEELGASFGDQPLNDFMWRTISQSENLAEFTAAMSLTFEQANLDFAAHYAKAFAAAGDHESARIIQQVFDEEVLHVRHGVHWFKQWLPESVGFYEAHESALKFPLTLARAQGNGFQIEARNKAGLPDDYIARLKLFSASKGRPPRVFFFNPTYELENLRSNKGFSAPKAVQELEDDLASLLSFVAHRDDVVLVKQKPSNNFLAEIQTRGFSLCEFYEFSGSNIDAVKFAKRHKHISSLQPWGWSPRSFGVLKDLQKLLVNQDSAVAVNAAPWLGKTFAHELRTSLPWQLDPLSQSIRVLRQVEELDQALQDIADLKQSPARWVAKAPLGASGNQHLRFERDRPLDDNPRGWMKNILSEQGALILEPWVEKFADLSVVGEVDSQGQVKLWGVTRFLTDEKGHYIGHMMQHPLFGLAQDVVRAANQKQSDEHSSYIERLYASAKESGQRLSALGYRGFFGIDAFIYNSEPWSGRREACLQALVEINTRWTMGHIAHQIQKRLPAKNDFSWRHLMKPALKTMGYEDFSAFANAMALRYGEGFQATNDPALAKQCLTYLISDAASEQKDR